MCEQVKFGFDCVCEHVEKFPGSIVYVCEVCGIYTASKPRCNKCEVEKPYQLTYTNAKGEQYGT